MAFPKLYDWDRTEDGGLDEPPRSRQVAPLQPKPGVHRGPRMGYQRPGSMVERVRQAALGFGEECFTSKDLEATSGCGHDTVKDALWRMERDGQVVRHSLIPPKRVVWRLGTAKYQPQPAQARLRSFLAAYAGKSFTYNDFMAHAQVTRRVASFRPASNGAKLCAARVWETTGKRPDGV